MIPLNEWSLTPVVSCPVAADWDHLGRGNAGAFEIAIQDRVVGDHRQPQRCGDGLPGHV
jgi:hypothetical protein